MNEPLTERAFIQSTQDVVHPIRAQFIDPGLEEKYQKITLAFFKKSAMVAIVVIMAPIVVFGYSDFLLFGFESTFYFLLGFRTVGLVLSVFTLFIILKRKIRIIFFRRLADCIFCCVCWC